MRIGPSSRGISPVKQVAEISRVMITQAGSDVSVVLDGGLANQLFQRAAGFVIAERTGREVRLNPRWLGTGGWG
jgi:hypothetical protein